MTHRSRFSLILSLLIVFSAPLLINAADDNTDQKSESKHSFKVKKNIVYGKVKKTKLLLDAYIPDTPGPHPSLLLVHGGAWAIGDKSHMAAAGQRAAALGYACFSIKYRLAPRHQFPAQIDDCRTATRWMIDHADEFKIDTGRLGAVGYSAGGQLVALLGAQGVKHKTSKGETTIRFKAIAAGGAPVDFRWMPQELEMLAYWLGGTREKLPQAYIDASPLAFVSRNSSPVFFFHGERDALVSVILPQLMVHALRQHGVESELYIVKGADHLQAFIKKDGYIAMEPFLQKYLKKDQPEKNAGKKSKAPAASATK